MSKDYSHIVSAVFESPWAILPRKYQEICGVLEARLAGAGPADFPEYRNPEITVKDGLAIIPVVGTMTKRASLFSAWSGGVSTEELSKDIQTALNDPNVRGILLNIDSPGGSVDGSFSLADMVFAARGDKPIVAFADGLTASAAYLLASAADWIVANNTAEVGSIGVVMTHTDRTKANEDWGIKRTVLTSGYYKAMGSPDLPLDKDAQAYFQAMLDQIYGLFVENVARNRGADAETVLKDMADGRIFIGQKALEAGLVDQIGEFEDAVAYARQQIKARETRVQKVRQGMNFSDAVKAVLEGRAQEAAAEHREIAVAVVQQVRDFDAAANKANTDKAVGEALGAERERSGQIIDACAKAGVPMEFGVGLMKSGEPAAAAMGKIIERAASGQQPLKAASDYQDKPLGADDENKAAEALAAAAKRLTGK